MKKKNPKHKKKKSSRKTPRSQAQNKQVKNASEAAVQSRNKAKADTYIPPKKTSVKTAAGGGGFFSRYLGIARQFLKEAKNELKKVKWPTRKELLASTAVVIVLTLFVALYLGLVDFGFMKLIKGLIG